MRFSVRGKAATLVLGTLLAVPASLGGASSAQAMNEASCGNRQDLLSINFNSQCFANAGGMFTNIPNVWAINPGNNDVYVFSTNFPGGKWLGRTCDASTGYCTGTSYVARFGTVTELYIL